MGRAVRSRGPGAKRYLDCSGRGQLKRRSLSRSVERFLVGSEFQPRFAAGRDALFGPHGQRVLDGLLQRHRPALDPGRRKCCLLWPFADRRPEALLVSGLRTRRRDAKPLANGLRRPKGARGCFGVPLRAGNESQSLQALVTTSLSFASRNIARLSEYSATARFRSPCNRTAWAVWPSAQATCCFPHTLRHVARLSSHNATARV